MHIILLGAPGAGKGTQATKISDRYGLPHISTGDIFRDNIKNETEIGLLAKSFIDKGQLVPDDVTCEIVEERIQRPDCEKGFMLDGFPRTIPQAKKLDEITNIDLVINIDVAFDDVMQRLCGRRVCKSCGESYHVSTLNGATTCSRCGGELYQRKDDNPETVKNRLQVYSAQTAPLIDYYTKKGVLFTVVSKTTAEDTFEKVSEKLDELLEADKRQL